MMHPPSISPVPRAVVDARGLEKLYGGVASPVRALEAVDLQVWQGEMVALRGPSGSGKSTLLNILGCLDRPTRGTYLLGGADVSALSRTAQAWVRLRYLGFVFQSFHLIAAESALENVSLPMYYAGVPVRERTRRGLELLDRVGLLSRARHRPAELSGGQKQRVAITRALALRPRLLLADEPTGALDTASGREVLALLMELKQVERLTTIVVTHDANVAQVADRQVCLRDGRIDDEKRDA
jgi:putative ABC transport system ATP-binding protein